ncbi:putative FKBP-type peptidyl-prolyl cis-trans isomerase [Blattamonas nauphoetae]|uniref:peptidylprolyl isomerase n=1 Tax=Blattamonas nauphoetae TaxID=2049346 RepID=A0ABQ9YFY2_9EUKA|nr:putative FKBP-type peptidyl-prolyl cis-trans isomerase [Blattamonas nauphoetae]
MEEDDEYYYEPPPTKIYIRKATDMSPDLSKPYVRPPSDRLTIETLSLPRRCPRRVNISDEVEISYTIMTYNDLKVMDETLDMESYVFRVGYGETIKGVDEGVVGSCVGEKRRLTFPSEMGFGANGSGPIKPNEALIVDITVLDMINRKFSEDYKDRIRSITESARYAAHVNREDPTQIKFQRPVRHSLTYPKEGLEAKTGTTRRHVRAIPYTRFIADTPEYIREDTKANYVRRRKRAWDGSENFAHTSTKTGDQTLKADSHEGGTDPDVVDPLKEFDRKIEETKTVEHQINQPEL